MWNRRNVVVQTLALGVCVGSGPTLGWAQPVRKTATSDELRTLVGRATRLSVLSDRITRCHAQKSLKILVGRADRVLAEATDDVRRGLAELAAAPLSDATKALLPVAVKSYEAFLGRSQQINPQQSAALGAFAEEADVVGDHMDALVAGLIKDLGQSVATVLASTADLQRLTQHTAVHFLMARVGIDEAEQLRQVADGRKAFNNKLQVLQNTPVKNPAIESQLQLLLPQWLLMDTALGRSGNDVKTLENISTTSERLLEVTSALYGLYEQALKAAPAG